MIYTPKSSQGQMTKFKKLRSNLSGDMMSSLIESTHSNKGIKKFEKFQMKKPKISGSLIEKLTVSKNKEKNERNEKIENYEYKQKFEKLETENSSLKDKLKHAEGELEKSQKLVEVSQKK
jgi:hypothetical protein